MSPTPPTPPTPRIDYTVKELLDYLADTKNEKDLRDRAKSGWPSREKVVFFEDVYQESLLKCLRFITKPGGSKIERVRGEPFPFLWFFRVFRNTYLEFLRRRSSWNTLSGTDFVADWAVFDPALEDRWYAIQENVKKLCDLCRKVIYLIHVEHLSAVECAAVLDMTAAEIDRKNKDCLTKFKKFRKIITED